MPFALWCFFSFYDGKIDAYYWYLKMNNKSNMVNYNIEKTTSNIHSFFTWRRLFVGAICFLNILSMSKCIFISLFYCLCLVLCFSFWHNGSYYLQRNRIDLNTYKNRFFDDSVTSTAIFEFNYKTRSNMFFAGIILLIIITIIWLY